LFTNTVADEVKEKAAPEVRGIALPILNLRPKKTMGGQRHDSVAVPSQKYPIPILQEVG
jgi:hypothetical protein